MLEDIEQEIETLSYIYTRELTINDPKSVSIFVENEDNDLQIQGNLLEVKIEFPTEYPECVPNIELQSEHLEEQEIAKLIDEAINECQNSIGMAMTFTIVSFLKDRFNQVLKERIKAKQLAIEQQKLDQEREEAQRYIGSRVTPETFKEWKAKFIKEAFEQEKLGNLTLAFEAAIAVERMNQAQGKKTGRQLFEDRNLMLHKSDEKYLDEGEDVVVEKLNFMTTKEDEDESNVGLLNFTED